MTFSEAFALLKDHLNLPVFSVKIGIGSPEVRHVSFEEALDSYSDLTQRFTTEYMEYCYIYVEDFVKEADRLNKALRLFNLGVGRGSLNTENNHT